MDRRHLLAALAVMAAAPAWAQQQAQQGAGASGEPIGQAEQKHAAETLAAGAVALEMSRVARDKAQNAWAKKFAQYEIAEQETIAEVLKSMGAQPAAMNAQETRMTQSMIKRLTDAPAGAAFDRAYVDGQIQGHQELLRIQEEYLAAGKDRSHVNVAKLARGQVTEHIDMLQTIKGELKA